MIVWKKCEATNCGKEFYSFEDCLDIVLCSECIEALTLLSALNFGQHPTMTVDEYAKLVEDYEEDPEE